MYISFVDKNGNTIRTDTDLGLTIEKITIGEPKVRSMYKEIPGRDDPIDYTDYFGQPLYDPRDIMIECGAKITNRYDQERMIRNAVHGLRFDKIILSDDPQWYFSGRVSMNEWSKNVRIGKCTLTAHCDPYRKKISQTVKTLSLTSSYKSLSIENTGKIIIPVFLSTVAATVKFDEIEYSFAADNQYRNPEIALQKGTSTIQAKSTSGSSGTLTVTYQEGVL